jgi:CrcB protein
MVLILYVAIGGAIGSAGRYLLTTAVQSRISSGFPAATLIINVTGSLLLGFITPFALETTAMSDDTRALLTVGFCGGYTTFSTFTYETARLMQDGDYRRAILYVGSSVVLGLIAMFVGFALARSVIGARSGIA